MIYLVTTSGYPNYGDELITASWLQYLALRAPQAQVWVDCPYPGSAAVLLDGIHPKARFVDTLWHLCWTAPSEEPWELAGWVQHAINDPGLAPQRATGIELLRGVDVIHIVGGGFIQDTWPRHIGLVAAAAATSRRFDARAALTGQGLTPTGDTTATLLATLADQFAVVDVRDEPSGELLRTAGVSGVRVSTDDAFLAIGDEPPGTAGELPAFAAAESTPGFILCAQSDMLHIEPAQLANLVLRTLRAWKVAPDDLGIVEAIPRVDRGVYALLEHELPGARFYPFGEVWRTGLPITSGQTWLSTRFHPHLLAAAAGAGGVAIPVSPDYYHAKHASLVAQGSGWTLAEDLTGQVLAELPTGGGFAPETVRTYHRNKVRLADEIYGPAADRRLR